MLLRGSSRARISSSWPVSATSRLHGRRSKHCLARTTMMSRNPARSTSSSRDSSPSQPTSSTAASAYTPPPSPSTSKATSTTNWTTSSAATWSPPPPSPRPLPINGPFRPLRKSPRSPTHTRLRGTSRRSMRLILMGGLGEGC